MTIGQAILSFLVGAGIGGAALVFRVWSHRQWRLENRADYAERMKKVDDALKQATALQRQASEQLSAVKRKQQQIRQGIYDQALEEVDPTELERSIEELRQTIKELESNG